MALRSALEEQMQYGEEVAAWYSENVVRSTEAAYTQGVRMSEHGIMTRAAEQIGMESDAARRGSESAVAVSDGVWAVSVISRDGLVADFKSDAYLARMGLPVTAGSTVYGVWALSAEECAACSLQSAASRGDSLGAVEE